MKFGNKTPMSSARKRQLMTAVTIFGVITAIGAGTAFFTKRNAAENQKMQEPVKKIEQTDLSKPDQILDGPAVWQADKGAKVDSLEQRIAQLEKEKAQQLENGNATALPNIDLSKTPPPPVAPEGIKAGGTLSVESNQSLIESITLSRQPNMANLQNAGNSDIANSGYTAKVSGVRPNIEVVSDGGKVINNSAVNEGTSSGNFRAQKSYVPSGTFFRVVLLGGIDAPTGGESQTANPHPVLMRVADMAQLPNRVRQNFKECFITGTGYGDLSSERAMIRTEQLSCVDKDGKAIDIAIKGWIAGEDGKAGIRGRLVSKQGAVLKNALISGVLSGLGQGFTTAATATTTTALGTVSSVSNGKQLQSALGSGAGNAFDRLAQYYIKLADKMFPVIEVDAGRRGDVVLLKGFTIGE